MHGRQNRTDEYTRALQFMFLRFASLTAIIGLVLIIVAAPLWVFYAAPMVLLPLLFWELPRLDRLQGSEDDPADSE